MARSPSTFICWPRGPIETISRARSVVADHNQVSPAFAAGSFQDGHGFGKLGGGDHRHVGLDDAGFFGRDFREGRAEFKGVVVAQPRDRAGVGEEDVRRVEAAAEAGFHHGGVHLLPLEMEESEEGIGLEETRRAERRTPHLLDRRPHLFHQRRDRFFRNQRAVNADALAEMRRGGERCKDRCDSPRR